ncbi:MAG: adaptor protein MecA [Oscillospiraceae bacterium]|nr:adaptor protein MecA [Oscillospiraceae bacterium]
MQIDILSSNTLKLTLSRLDMFDLDIKYESLSGKNPETKRLLAHVLKSIRLDRLNQKTGFDFSCERIFVEAFPRPDGGCMLYVSSLEADAGRRKKQSIKTQARESFTAEEANLLKAGLKREDIKSLLIFETDAVNELSGVCRSLCRQKEWERLGFESALYLSENRNGEMKYRLIIKNVTGRQTLISGIIREYGEPYRGELELAYTEEYFRAVIKENAAEKLGELL